jgi:phytanoyl-CoA hydroxylase
MENIDINLLKESYRRDGFVVVRGFLDKNEIASLNQALGKVIREKIPSMPANHVVYEDPSNPATLKLMQDLHLYDPYFSDVLFKSKFEKIAEVLMGDSAIGKTVEYFNKPAKVGKPTPVHQDGYYFMLQPPEATTMWLALEDVDEENGCVRYVKGSHLKSMRAHGRTKTAGFSQAIVDYGNEDDMANEVAIPAKPGDLLIHHAMTIHRADGNSSVTRSRRALGLIYFSAAAKEDKAAKEAYLKVLAEEKARAV